MPRALFLLLACGLLGACGGDAPFDPDKAIRDPSLATLEAPPHFTVRFETTKGEFVVEAIRLWAPHGVDRFYNLVRMNYFTDIAFYRVIKSFMVQFGIHDERAINAAWGKPAAFIRPDPSLQPNRRGYMTFGQIRGPSTRATQLFINYKHNRHLDRDFAPIGRVVSGMEVVDSLYGGYGESAPGGRGPVGGRLAYEGNEYLRREFPKIDYIRRATLVE